MKKVIFVLIISGLGFASCNKEPQPLTKQEIKQKIDSTVSAKMKDQDEQAAKDLQNRIKIEVKVKVDSILNASLTQQQKDSIQRKKAAK